MEYTTIIQGVFSLFVIASFFMLVAGLYNRLVSLSEEVNKAWVNIEVILKQRYDELPRLVEICNQFIKHETGIIDRILSAREKMVGGKSKEEMIEASNEISNSFQGLLAVGESYPDIKSNQNFMQIQTRISSLEESLSDRREYFNSAVTNHNIRIRQIPYVFFANLFGFKAEPLFKVKDFEKEYPSLKINTIKDSEK